MPAINGVARQKELGCCAGKPQSIFATCVNHHAFLNWFGAGDDRIVLTFNLHKAKATRGGGLRPFSYGTEVGDIDAVLQRNPEEFLSLMSFYLLSINCQEYILRFH